MRQELYLQFYKRIKNQFLAVIFTNIFYCLICLKYIVKKIFRKKKISTMSLSNAKKLIDEVYPHPIIELDFYNPPINEEIDLSIVVTVYNYGHLLEENIATYLDQNTKYKYELIFVNDGSTDNSREVLEKFVDNPKVKILDRPNGGLSAARNSGIKCATGKYLMFIDCDDKIHNDMVEDLLNEAYSKDCDLVMGAHNLIRIKDGKVISILPSIYSKYNLLAYKNNNKIMNYPGFAWGKAYKRSLFDNVRYPESYWYEDTVTHFLLFTQCENFSYIEKPYYDYFWHDKNISHLQGNTKSLKTIDRYWLLVDIIDQYKRNSLPIDNRFYTLIIKHVSAYFYKNICLLDDNVIEALFVLVKQIIDEYKPDKKVKLPYMLRQVEKAFEKKDMALWALSSTHQ